MSDDPLAGQREHMPAHEFDAVDYFVNTPGRGPMPPPKLGVYLDSGLTQPQLADRLPALLSDLLAVLAETTTEPMRPREAAHAVLGEPPRDRRWRGESTLRWLADALRTNQAEGINLDIRNPDGAAEDLFWYLECWCVPERTDAAIELSVTPSDGLWPAEATDAVAERLLTLVESWVAPLALLTGCVTYDHVQPHYSPWDLWYNANHDVVAPLTREYARGYYWANLLTTGQLRRLGGVAELRRRAGELVVRELPDSAVVVRGPGPVTTFDDGQLTAMKELLAPVLIPRPYTVYEGWPLRIIPDPGTAFRRVPATRPRPMLLPRDPE